MGRIIHKMKEHTFLFTVELKDQNHQIDEIRSTMEKVD